MKLFSFPVLLVAGSVAGSLADPVCIIGAGPAGLSAAHALEAEGTEVIIFEKQSAVGGKCQAYYDNDTYHPLGALLFTNDTYRETLKIINAGTTQATEFLDGVPRWEYDLHNGSIQAATGLNAGQEALLVAEIARYAAFWETGFAPISHVGYRQPIPKSLTVSTADWFEQNGYQVLPVLFNLGMFSYGYGDMRQVSIWYMLQYFAPDVVGAFAQISPSYLIDFHQVFVQYSSSVKGKILLGAEVVHVERTNNPIITYSTGSSSGQIQSCSQLILAFPPTVTALSSTLSNVSDEETSLFSAVGTVNYFSGAVTMAIPPHQLFFASSPTPASPPEAAGEPVGIIRFEEESNVTTTWSWAPFGQNVSEAQALSLLKQTLSLINRNPAELGSQAMPVGASNVKGFSKQDYFPQVSGDELGNGWYQRLDKLQGKNDTYYASGLNAFESVEFAIRAGQDVVATYFKTKEAEGRV